MEKLSQIRCLFDWDLWISVGEEESKELEKITTIMKVVTPVVNNPHFIEIQYWTLKKYMQCSYEFIVFNDAKDFPDFTNDGDITIKRQIDDVCKKLGIECINIPNEHHHKMKDAAIRCADSYNYVLQYQKENPDIYLAIDSDMFLIDYFNPEEHYREYDAAVVIQRRDSWDYFWNGLFYFNMLKMKNQELLDWNVCSNGNHTDVGGSMNPWLKSQTKNIPDGQIIRWNDTPFHCDGIYYIRHLWSCSWNESEIPENLKNNSNLLKFLKSDPRNKDGKFFCEIYDKKFLHYRAGGNWMREGIRVHTVLSKLLKELLLK